MFRKVRVYPNGKIEYYYHDKVVIDEGNGVSQIKSTLFNKEKNEQFISLQHSSFGYRSH
jgi:hypothetical protein